MGRAVFAMLTVAAVLALGLRTDDLGGQEIPDPGPAKDAESIESELPAPADIVPPPSGVGQAFLGVTFDPRVRNAAVARSVSAGSPAEQSGVEAGDTIVGLNGLTIDTYDDVLKTLAGLRPGDVLDIEISRRISIRTQAVLGGGPVANARTPSYRAEAEPLPAPRGYENRPRADQAPDNTRFLQPRPNFAAPENRAGEADRDEEPSENDRRGLFRGRFLRRRG